MAIAARTTQGTDSVARLLFVFELDHHWLGGIARLVDRLALVALAVAPLILEHVEIAGGVAEQVDDRSAAGRALARRLDGGGGAGSCAGAGALACACCGAVC